MYRVFALASLGLSFLLILTDATMALASPALALASGSWLLTSLPSALALVFAAIARKLRNIELNAVREQAREQAEDYYAPLTRMIRVFELKDREEPLVLGS